MRREDRRRRFHEALLSKFYPPPSPPSVIFLPGEEEEEKSENKPDDFFDVTLINPDDYVETAPSISDGDGGDESEDSQKLSRAQRKRLRKKKLKEEASRRGKLIGPLLPQNIMEEATGCSDTGCKPEEDDGSGKQCVRRIADEKNSADFESLVKGVETDDDASGKAKKRRTAKRIAKKRLQSSE